MPKLPVARVLLKPRPDLPRAAECWIIAGGAHHTGYSRFVKTEWMRDWAEMAGIEFLLIGARTEPRSSARRSAGTKSPTGWGSSMGKYDALREEPARPTSRYPS